MLEHETTEVACGPHHVVAITCKYLNIYHAEMCGNESCYHYYFFTADGLVFAWGKGDKGMCIEIFFSV